MHRRLIQSPLQLHAVRAAQVGAGSPLPAETMARAGVTRANPTDVCIATGNYDRFPITIRSKSTSLRRGYGLAREQEK